MEFRFTQEEEQFRQEVRRFIEQELPADIAEGIGQEEAFRADVWPRIKGLRRKLAEKNWIAISWPKQYGGLGETLIKQAIFKEEMAYWRCPGIDPQAYQLG